MLITRRQWLTLTLSAIPCHAFAGRDVDDEICTLARLAPLSLQFHGTTASQCRAWQQMFSTKLKQLLGTYEPPAQWETIRERTVNLEDHRRDELVLRASGHRDLPVYLLSPGGLENGRRPGIVALHGHGEFGYDAVAGIAASVPRKKEIEELHYDYGLQLVRQGYVVVIPCFTPFGRRLGDRQAYDSQDPCAITFIRMQLLGKLLIAENLHDALWSLELIAQHESVDPRRLGCVGLSTGGRMTMLAAALAPKIKVAVISGALNVMQERITGRYSCGAQIIPGLLQYGDVPEIASLIAPRPCLWEVGNQDPLMVREWIEPALERVRRAYRALDALDSLQVDFFEGEHRWNGIKAYPLLARVLKPNA